jgi:hypothetical protein
MRLKKFLQSYKVDNSRRSGQVVVEYFILFALLAALTLIAGSVYFAKMSHSTERFETAALDKINAPVD